MYTVIDRIPSYPGADGLLKEHPDCLLLILAPEEIRAVNLQRGQQVQIHTPSGNILSKSFLGSEVHHGVVGLYVEHATKDEIPRLPSVSWENK